MIDTGKKVSLDVNGNYVLYNADCIDVLVELDPESVDLVVTSPPYDALRTYEGTCRWDFDVFKSAADRLYRVLKKGGVIVWIVSDATVNGSETGSSFRQALYFKSIGMNIHDTMIWRKQTSTDTGSLRVRYGNVFEYMFIFSKGKPKTFNPLMNRVNKGAGRKKSAPVVQPDGSRTPISSKGKAYRTMGQRFNVWDVNTVVSKEERTGHPAQFPYLWQGITSCRGRMKETLCLIRSWVQAPREPPQRVQAESSSASKRWSGISGSHRKGYGRLR